LIPGLRHLRHAVVHVPGATRAAALAAARSLSEALAGAFDARGAGHLDATVRPRAAAVPGAASHAAFWMLTLGAAALGLFAATLLRSAWRDWRARSPGDLPPGVGFGVAAVLALAIAPAIIPGWLILALFAMAIPTAIAGTIVFKLQQVRRAARWPSAQDRIVRSQLRTARRRKAEDATTVTNVPDIEYAYAVDGVEYRSTRISLGDLAPGSPEGEAALQRYQVGRTGPVFYNPDNPREAVLERDPPASPALMYGLAVGVLAVGLAVVIAFTRAAEIFAWMQPWFPPGAFVPGVLFFVACGAVVLLSLASNRRAARAAARWPTIAGTVLPASPNRAACSCPAAEARP
jgi:hypothetical protein